MKNFQNGLWKPENDIDKVKKRLGTVEGKLEIEGYIRKFMAAVNAHFKRLCNKPTVHILIHSIEISNKADELLDLYDGKWVLTSSSLDNRMAREFLDGFDANFILSGNEYFCNAQVNMIQIDTTHCQAQAKP